MARMTTRKSFGLLAASATVFAVTFGVTEGRSVDPSAAQDVRVHAFKDVERSLVLSIRKNSPDGEWGLGKFTNALNEACVEIRSPAGWRAANCVPADDTAKSDLSAINVGGTGETYVFGIASANVRSVDLIASGCPARSVEMNDGLFLWVGPANAKVDALVARDASRRVIQERNLQLPVGTPERRSPNC